MNHYLKKLEIKFRIFLQDKNIVIEDFCRKRQKSSMDANMKRLAEKI